MANLLGDLIHFVSGRLTLESGVPISTADQTAKTTIYFTPFRGNAVPLYNTVANVWYYLEFSEISLSLSGFTANKNNDIFVYDNSGTLTMERVEWTNDSTRATALAVQDGRYVKNGDASRLYIGTFRTTGVTGQCEDSVNNRFVWNYYNRIARSTTAYQSTASYTYTTAAWRESNAGTGMTRGKFIIGVQEEIAIIGCRINATTNNANASYFYVEYDSVAGSNLAVGMSFTSALQVAETGSSPVLFAAGYHYITLVEYCAAGTMTAYGGSSLFSYGFATLLM